MPGTPTKTSPFLFSKYIESVHKALHGGANNLSSNNNNSVDQQQDNLILNDGLNDSISSSQSMPKRFVEHRRQLFENPHTASLSRTSSVRQSDDKELTPLAEKSPFYFNNNTINYLNSNQRVDGKNDNSNEINDQILRKETPIKKNHSYQAQSNSSRASSLG